MISSEYISETHEESSMCPHGNFVGSCEMCKNETELSPVEKRKLLDFWHKVILGDSPDSVDDVGDLSRDEMRDLLHKKLMERVGDLLEQFGIETDESLIEQIFSEEDLNKKAELEVVYIRRIHKVLDDLVKKFDHSKPKSTKWNSWPGRIADTKEFNCVGAVLLGTKLLEKAGVQQFTGNPPGHVVNIARLSNGDWWFVDFLNGENNVQKIEPVQREISGHQVLEIDHPMIDYRLVPITPKEEVGKYVVGNLASLQINAYEARDTEQIDDIEISEAVAYAVEHGLLEMNDLSEYRAYLFPSEVDFSDASEMQAESERIERLHAIVDVIAVSIKGFSVENIRKIFEEINRNEQVIRKFFYEDDLSIFNDSSPELAKLLNVYRDELADFKENHREEYEEVVEKMLRKVAVFVEAYTKQLKN